MGHLSLSDRINEQLAATERNGGLALDALRPGDEIVFDTSNRRYRMRRTDAGQLEIKGHIKYCPDWTSVASVGSSWGGSLFKPGLLGREMYLHFKIPDGRTVRTSPVIQILSRDKAEPGDPLLTVITH